MQKVYTLAASLLFVVFAAIGQLIGRVAGDWLYRFYDGWGLNIPSFVGDIAPIVISGIGGGWLAALGCSKVYRNYHPKFILIIPAFLMLIAIIGSGLGLVKDGLSSEGVGLFLANFAILFMFYYSLRNLYPPSAKILEDNKLPRNHSGEE